MIYCLNCGKGIPDQSKFCTFCGAAIKPAEQSESTSQPIQETTTPPQQQYINPTPPPPKYVDPTPPQQQYVPPPQQQYVQPQQQYVNPPAQHYVSPQPVATKNEFYKNIGFWGAVFILVSAFLPWVTADGTFDFNGLTLMNLYYLGFDLDSSTNEGVGVLLMEIVLGIILLCSLLIIIDSFTSFLSRGMVKFIKLLPFILVIILFLLIFIGVKDRVESDEFIDGLSTKVGIGIWLMLLGVILLLFYKKFPKFKA